MKAGKIETKKLYEVRPDWVGKHNCDFCKEKILNDVIICQYCGKNICDICYETHKDSLD